MESRQTVGKEVVKLIRDCENIVALSAVHRQMVEVKRKQRLISKERNDKR